MKKVMTAAAVAVVLSTASANALTVSQEFNFVEMADVFWDASEGFNIVETAENNQFEATWDQGVSAHETGAIGATDGFWDGSIAGGAAGGGVIEVKASPLGGTSTTPDPVGSQHAFLDADRGSGPAGLGVCSTGISGDFLSRCSSNFTRAGGTGVNDAGDDNVADPEVLELMFNQEVKLALGAITDSNHDPAIGNVEISVDGGEWMDVAVFDGLFTDPGTLRGTTFWFRPDDGQGYLAGVVASTVPVPAGAWLLIGGLGMLGAARRRRKAA